MATVVVSKTFLDSGKLGGAAFDCAVALAINAMLLPGLDAGLRHNGAFIFRGNCEVARYEIPYWVSRRICEFDIGECVEPFEFSLPIDEYVRPEFREHAPA